VAPRDIDFVEAHGTGTAVGDPIEANALAKALCPDRTTPLPIGSVKTNLGHLETAAGMAGLIKALLVLKNRQIPASLHFDEPSEHIDFETLKLRVPTELEPLPEKVGPRYVGINSFGFGGANTHVIVTEAPAAAPATSTEAPNRSWPIVTSARSDNALRSMAGRLSAALEAGSHANGSSPTLPDLAYTLGARRNHHAHRLTLVADSLETAIQEFADFARGDESPNVRTSFTPRPERAPRIAFVLGGQGPQWWGLGRDLMRNEPTFRASVERSARALDPWTDFSLLQELARDEDSSEIHRTEIAQPALFAMNVALAELWRSWGVEPAAIVGHSVSEVAAAHLAGILDLDTAARLIALRARFMEQCARGEGAMLAVGMSADKATSVAARYDRTITISAVNSPTAVTLSGPRSALEPLAAELEGQNVFARILRVDHPFHHALMQPAADELTAELADIDPRAEIIPFFSTVTGKRCDGTSCVAGHWGDGIRQAVRFSGAVDAVAETGIDVWLEISAHPILAQSLRECLATRDATDELVVASARRDREHGTFLDAALDLHRAGVVLDFTAISPSRRLIPLPAYAWDRARWWSESRDWRDGRLAPGGRGLLDCRLPRANPTWSGRLDARHLSYLQDHKVDTRVIFPAAGFIELALEVGVELFEGRPFAIEDFEIRKPLLVPEDPSTLNLELSVDEVNRTFAIHSRIENSWSLHVVGSLRGERTENEFASSTWQPDFYADVPVDGFYQHLADLGLRYGPEFKPLQRLSATNGCSTGHVGLSERTGTRADEYALHPVLLDGALHVFSAAAATVEDRRARMKLPVRFGRILFLRSPGASANVRADIRDFSDEFLEGGLALYDAAGQPCVQIDGFRAVSLAGTRRAGSSTGSSTVTYRLDWDQRSLSRETPTEPLPLSDLRDAARSAFDHIVGIRGRDRLESAMAASDDLAAAHLALGLRQMGVRSGSSVDSETLGISPDLRPAFNGLIADLEKRGLIENQRALPKFDEIADSARTELRGFLARNPGHAAEGILCESMCAELGPILRGEKDAVQVLFAGGGPDLLEQFYGDGLLSSHWLSAIAAAVETAASTLPEGRGLRILEIGAGTGGLAAHVLPNLPRKTHSYAFTDASPAFFSTAGQKLAAFPEVEFEVFDLEKSGADQGFAAESYDLIVGTNVLHAVADIRQTLGYIHDLLAPGGSLIFMDTASPQLWTETVFGLTSGWWRFTDRDLRPDQPLLERAQWETILEEAGFAETTSLPGLTGPRGGEGQMTLFARKASTTPKPAPIISVPSGESWLLVSDDSDLVDEVAQLVPNARIVSPDDEMLGDSGSTPNRILFFSAENTDALLTLTQNLPTPDKLHLTLVTRGAQPAGTTRIPVNVDHAAALGLLRVIANEYPNLTCRAIDLPLEAQSGDAELLLAELQSEFPEREMALRGDARYVRRLRHGQAEKSAAPPPSVPLRLRSKDRGHLDTLEFAPFTLPPCGPGEVLVDTVAAGMNFRDVLKALALYPGEAPDAAIFGDEIGGIVREVGPDVKHLSVGDRVFGLATFGLATRTLARGGDLRRVPTNISFEEAATLPVVFMTAWHAIVNVARLRKGESILVQAGTGGVGMAAIQIARHLGMTVIATAGNPAKRALLKTLGVDHVIDSRRADFADAVMTLTDRRGVDAVLNSLAAEAIPMGLACLAEFGRFLEIGKRDIYQNSKLPLWNLRRNASFHVIAMDAVFGGDEALTAKLLGEVSDLVEAGALRPLPFRAYPANRVDGAFRLMAQGKHVGKVVVTFAESSLPRRTPALRPGFTVDADAAYLVTGAFGGYGVVLARWLADCGARHLVLTSRSGPQSEAAKSLVDDLAASGVTVQVEKVDVRSTADTAKLIRSIIPPLKGVFHLAMAIDDAPIVDLTPERMSTVLEPKADGAWNLHNATQGLPLDAFVLFSSVSSVFGNPAQGNYAAANAYLDALAHHRQALGLPGLAVNWGVLGGEGYVARNQKVGEFLARQGTEALSPGEVTSLLESFLENGVDQAIAIRVEWGKWRQFFRGLQDNPLLEDIFASGFEDSETTASKNDWRAKLDAAAPEEREAVTRAAVRSIVGGVLRVKPDTLRDDQPLTDLGLDSLMGVEIETSLESSLGVGLPPTSLMRARTIGQIAVLITEHLGTPTTASPDNPSADAPAAKEVDVDEIDLDELTEDDLDGLLDDSTVIRGEVDK
ncbi:MAG: acyltransferase domain-containing protein, partial [Chthoniobacterales bacterium]